MRDIKQMLAYGHDFLICVGELVFSCSKITGISDEIEIDTIQEGGVNDRVILLTSPKKSSGTLTFEHGIGRVSNLNKAFNASMFGHYFLSPGTILTYCGTEKIKRAYGFNGAKPIKWSLSGFDAKEGNLLIDTIEIMHQGVFEITID